MEGRISDTGTLSRKTEQKMTNRRHNPQERGCRKRDQGDVPTMIRCLILAVLLARNKQNTRSRVSCFSKDEPQLSEFKVQHIFCPQNRNCFVQISLSCIRVVSKDLQDIRISSRSNVISSSTEIRYRIHIDIT